MRYYAVKAGTTKHTNDTKYVGSVEMLCSSAFRRSPRGQKLVGRARRARRASAHDGALRLRQSIRFASIRRNKQARRFSCFFWEQLESAIQIDDRQFGLQLPRTSALAWLRRGKWIASIPGQSGIYVSTGFCTVLARFLESDPDRHSPLTGVELAARKLRLVSLMAGNFNPEGMQNPTPKNAEYNIVTDISSAARAVRLCPVPMVFSGFEVGDELRFPHRSE